MIDIIKKYKAIMLYLIFGALTTLVNVLSYWIAAYLFRLQTIVSTIIAWILAVFFAYLTNRKWVFESQTVTRSEVIKEITSFFSCRLATGIVDWGCMFIFVNLLAFNDLIIKFLANMVVIILNYAASKLIIFKKRK